VEDGGRRPESTENVGGSRLGRRTGDNVPVKLWGRRKIPWTRLVDAKLLVTAACSGRTPSRRIGGGKQAAALDSVALHDWMAQRRGTSSDELGRARPRVLPFIGARATVPALGTHAHESGGGAPSCPGLWPMGLARARRLEWVGPAGASRAFGLGPFQRIRFVFFEFIYNAKTIPEKYRNCLKA
jgi:hypothetical protein